MTEQINETQENKEEVTVNHLSEAKQSFRRGFDSMGLFFTEKADKIVKTGKDTIRDLTEKLSKIVEKIKNKIPGQARDKQEKVVEEQKKEDNDAQNKPGDQ